MSDDFTHYVVRWCTGHSTPHMIDFDSPAMASYVAHDIEGLSGIHSVSVTETAFEGPNCSDEVKARIDAVVYGRIGLECGRLRLKIKELEETIAEKDMQLGYARSSADVANELAAQYRETDRFSI